MLTGIFHWSWGVDNYFEPWSWLCCYGVGLLAYELPSRFRWSRLAAVGVLALALVPLLDPVAVWLGFESTLIGWPFGLLFILPAVGYALAWPPAFLRRWALVAVGECSYALYLFPSLVP